jgi:hypothetical protein
MSLFAAHEAREIKLEEMAEGLLHRASILNLHAWYRSEGGILEQNLAAASEDAEAAARILMGETP